MGPGHEGPMTEPTLSTSPAAPSRQQDVLVTDSVRALDEAIAVLGELPAAEYAAESPVGSTVGAHFRHVLDHYLCLLDGLDGGLIHYEGRRRDAVIETDREAALALAGAICARLHALPNVALSRPVRVRCMAGELAEVHHGDHLSTAPRELHFVLLHAVHHYSFIAVELRRRGYTLDPDFGVAPATRAWRRSRA